MKHTSFEAAATRVSLVSMVINLLLAAFKFAAGVIGRSGAMISDAIHSSSDVLGSLIVIVGVRMLRRSARIASPKRYGPKTAVSARIYALKPPARPQPSRRA